MRCVPILFLAVTLCGCQTFGSRKTASGWYALQKAEAADCAPWPMNLKDLKISELMLVRGEKPGILASGINRDGSPLHYWTPFSGGVTIDKDDLVPLSFGRSAVLAGGSVIAGTPVAAVVYNAKGKATVELRQVKDNLVRYKGELAPAVVGGGSMTPAASGAWLSYRRDDGGLGLARFDWKAKGKVTLKLATGADFKTAPVIVPQSSGGGALAFVKVDDSGHPFKARVVSADGAIGAPQSIDFGIVNQAESWSATGANGTYYIAAVDGDSLIGQSNLRVGAIGWGDSGPSLKWAKEAPLRDVHVTEPVFLQTAKGLQVLLLNWVDEESTIARFSIAAGTLAQPVYSGIFPKGARIVEAFTDESGDEIFVIVRHRDDTRWAFQVCKL